MYQVIFNNRRFSEITVSICCFFIIFLNVFICDVAAAKASPICSISKMDIRGGSNSSVCANDNDAKEFITKNRAIIFIKPHANTPTVQEYVRNRLLDQNIFKIITEKEISSDEIEKKKLIDLHYYAIASKATLLNPHELTVPEAKFRDFFGIDYSVALQQKKVWNALDLCKKFSLSAEQLDALWKKAESEKDQVIKIGGGFYCGYLSDLNVYVMNGFFMSMRSQFVKPNTSIHLFEVEWESNQMKWEDFRHKFLGVTDPSKAQRNSIRNVIFKEYKKFDLDAEPNKSMNAVHASASPFEGLVEKMNWLQQPPSSKNGDDQFGKYLVKFLGTRTLQKWSRDPVLFLDAEKETKGSLFDSLEDMDVQDCLGQIQSIYEFNS